MEIKENNKGESKLDGRYANYFKVGQNAYEFVLDFGQLYQQNGAETFHTRIITSPVYAKALLDNLLESINNHEKEYGPIEKVDN